MKREFKIEGMTCGGCVGRVQKAMNEDPRIADATIQLEGPQAVIEFNDKTLSVEELQAIIDASGGHYTISQPVPNPVPDPVPVPVPVTSFKPLVIIVSFITGVSILAQWPFADGFDGMLWMQHFMAGFFLVFSGFKMFNLKGFVDSYRMYDLGASWWPTWGLIYPFIELGLGLLYLTGESLEMAHGITIAVLGFSSIGVIRSVLSKQTIRCACLGDVFNLPMTTVTIVEDLAMVIMAALMLALG